MGLGVCPVVGRYNVYLLSKVQDAWSNTISVTYTNNDRLYRVAQTVPGHRAVSGVRLRRQRSTRHIGFDRTLCPEDGHVQLLGRGSPDKRGDMGGYAYSYAYDGGCLTEVRKGASVRATVSYSALPATWTATNAYWVQLADAGGITNGSPGSSVASSRRRLART